MTTVANNVVYLQTLITIPDTAAVSEDTVTDIYEAVVAIKQKIEAQKLYLEKGIEILKKYMGDSEVLISKDGRRLATWEQQKDRIFFDIDELKKNFPEEYMLCCSMKKGNKPFTLK